MKILWHQLFHQEKYDELLYDFGWDWKEHEYDQKRFYKCSKCGVHSEDYGYKYENEVRFEHSKLGMGELTHYINYYKDDKEYKKAVSLLMAEELSR